MKLTFSKVDLDEEGNDVQYVRKISSTTIRGEITKGNVTTALGYTPNTPTEVDTKIDTKINDLESYVITNDDIDSIFS